MAAFCAVVVTVVAAVPAMAVITPVPNNSTGAASLAAAVAAPGFSPGAAVFDAVPTSGTPNAVSTTALAGFPTVGPSYAILTTGDANIAGDPNNSTGSSTNLFGPNVRGNTDLDVTVLKIPFTASANQNCLTFDFRFLSEEYPEYVGTQYNDAFIAEVDHSTWTTSGSTISAPNNFAFDPTHDVISINSSGATSMSAGEAAGTTYDGATPLLAASTAVTPGAHALYLSIFDQGDHVLDSAVFADGLGLGFVPNPNTQCKPGATPFNMTLTPATATNPVGASHTVTANLTQGGAPIAGKSVKFSVTGVNPKTGTGTTNASGNATFTYTGLNAGTDTIVGCFDETNNGDCEASASASKTWTTTPNSPTTCVVTAVRSGPPAQQDVTVRDLDGVASIFNVHVINGTVAVPTFTSGNKGPLVLTATKTDQTKRTFWEFDVKDSQNVVRHCV